MCDEEKFIERCLVKAKKVVVGCNTNEQADIAARYLVLLKDLLIDLGFHEMQASWKIIKETIPRNDSFGIELRFIESETKRAGIKVWL